MRRVDVYLAVAAVAFIGGATALVDLGRLGAGMAMLAVAVLAVFFAIVAADAPVDVLEAPDEDLLDDRPPNPYLPLGGQ